jgi:hypothetical protein
MRRRVLVSGLGARAGSRLLAASLVAFVLAGCASSAEQKAADEKTCAGYGYKSGSDEFSKCMMTIAQNREKQRDQDMNAVQMQQSIMMAPNCPSGMCW